MLRISSLGIISSGEIGDLGDVVHIRRGWDWSNPKTVGLVVAALVLVALYAPSLIARLNGPAAVDPPRFPSTVGTYSSRTNWLAAGEMQAASLFYQNGVGVEFMDNPMAVLQGADGSTYRRLARAEARSTPMDQGDSAPTVLSPDGTFVVIGSSGATGDIDVVTLQDGRRRTLSVGKDRAPIPVAIGADSQTVLLATSDEDVNRYGTGERLGLASIDLATGRVRNYPRVRELGGAAPSPDGKRIAVVDGDTFYVIDADSGERVASIPVEIKRDPRCEDGADESLDDADDSAYTCPELGLDGDAWSPDGRRIAANLGTTIVVADLSGAEPSVRRLPLAKPDYSAAALGWRDDSTVLVHAPTDGDENNSVMLWVDVTTGAAQTFATYQPNFTGASMVAVDAARDLIPKWQVSPLPVDRGPLPLWSGLLRAAAAGLLAMLVATAVRRRAADI